ncbi:MAG: hypothetical protein EP330_03960 [Deltaproteobacteria bacterium]|nr:MAG: hypothetical protein EP330_03960 [Deltaproteobacteria bacterium]
MDTIGDLPEMDDPTIEGYAGDLPWVRRVALMLNLLGVLQLLGVLGMFAAAALMSAPATGDPMLDAQLAEQMLPMRIMYGVMGTCCSLPFAVLHFVAASNLSGAKKWAWFLSLILSALYVPSLCFPVGALMVFGLVQEDVRRRFLG